MMEVKEMKKKKLKTREIIKGLIEIDGSILKITKRQDKDIKKIYQCIKLHNDILRFMINR